MYMRYNCYEDAYLNMYDFYNKNYRLSSQNRYYILAHMAVLTIEHSIDKNRVILIANNMNAFFKRATIAKH